MKLCLAAALLLALPTTVAAQPASPAKADKTDARSLLQSGLKLFNAKDYLGALAVFRDAYARFPSAKILVNIGTTLKALNRKPEAANAYQRYLDAPDTDPARTAEIGKLLADLDKSVAIVAITVVPPDAEVQINDEDWQPAAQTKRYRVAPGDVRVQARRAAYRPGATSTTIGAGEVVALTITLAVPTQTAVITTPASPTGTGVRAVGVAEAPRSRLGALAMGHFDIEHPGGAGLVGFTFDVTDRLQVQAAALLGKHSGGYAGASFSILTGKVRPQISAGMPIFASSGARYAVRGAGGVELAFTRHFSLVAEVGVEHLFNAEAGIDATEIIPALGVVARL